MADADYAVIDITDNTFEREVLQETGLVLVDFWASWCGPCRLMAPLMTWAAETYGTALKVAKIDADDNPFCRDRYRVQGLPTLILFRSGSVLNRHEGAMAKAQLQAFLDVHL